MIGVNQQEDHPEQDDDHQGNLVGINLQRENDLMENKTKVNNRPADSSIDLPKLVQREQENEEEDDAFMDYIINDEGFVRGYPHGAVGRCSDYCQR